MAMAIPRPRSNRWLLWLVVAAVVVGGLALLVDDWGQLWKISSTPDNIPIVAIILFGWSILLNAPLEEPANPNLTMNPSKAPWYFLGLQEMLVYFDPWIAGVVMPSLLLVGLMVFPYVDSNPLGNGYYSWRQRRFAIGMFLWGFFMWIILIIIGTFIRGPGWIWFWPGQTWDHNAVVYDRNVDLHEYIGITGVWGKAIFGALVVGAFYVLGGMFFHWLMTRNEFDRK